jgi:competence protein ComEC
MKGFARVLACLAVAILLAGCVQPGQPVAPVPSGDNLTAYFIDVGQGDSILLKEGNISILIDGGTTEGGKSVIGMLARTGTSRLDLVVATHPDFDHIGGLAQVLAVGNVSAVWDDGFGKATKTYEEYYGLAKEKNISFPKRGAEFAFNDISISVLNPAPDEFPPDDANDNSIVLLVRKGTASFLLMGDCATECEGKLALPEATVLKVGHHGSQYSTSDSFLGAVRPKFAIISVGASNTYGHPAAATLGRLTSAGARIFRTDRDGTIVATTDGKNGVAVYPLSQLT